MGSITIKDSLLAINLQLGVGDSCELLFQYTDKRHVIIVFHWGENLKVLICLLGILTYPYELFSAYIHVLLSIES